MRRVLAVVAHDIPDRPPLRLEPGDAVDVGERDADWPAFVFITTERGSGWVPERHLSVRSGAGVAIAPYDTTELPTVAGDELVVVEDDRESGWLWCRSPTGREGWVPASRVRDVP